MRTIESRPVLVGQAVGHEGKQEHYEQNGPRGPPFRVSHLEISRPWSSVRQLASWEVLAEQLVTSTMSLAVEIPSGFRMLRGLGKPRVRRVRLEMHRKHRDRRL